MRTLIFSLLILFTACNAATTFSSPEEKVDLPKLIWHWQDKFTPSEKEKIKKYITKVTQATFKVLGEFPFPIHYYFHRRKDRMEPIPWAHTERSKNIQGVRFYINPDFSEEVFFNDWTAPHEISHLAIPFVGKENSWFAEGFASYMQYQIMEEMGVYSKKEVEELYTQKIENIKEDYSEKLNFIENAKVLRSQYNFKAMYWGGAKYFMQINVILIKDENTSLNSVLKKFQSYRAGKRFSFEKLLNEFDKNFKKPVFLPLFNECQSKSFEAIYLVKK